MPVLYVKIGIKMNFIQTYLWRSKFNHSKSLNITAYSGQFDYCSRKTFIQEKLIDGMTLSSMRTMCIALFSVSILASHTSLSDECYIVFNIGCDTKGNMHTFWPWGSKWPPYIPDTDCTFIFSFKSKIRQWQPFL